MTKRNRIDSPYVDEPALFRLPELLDVFTAGHRERHRAIQFLYQKICRQGRFQVEGAIERCDHRLFDFRSAEPVARADDLAQIELFGVLFSKTQVDLPNGLPL